MRKKDPIASKNRTYLFIKNTFKLRLVRSLYFAYFFNELKKPGLISLNKARKSALKQKYLFKKIGQIYLWMNPISKKIEKKLVHKKSKKTTNSLLLG